MRIFKPRADKFYLLRLYLFFVLYILAAVAAVWLTWNFIAVPAPRVKAWAASVSHSYKLPAVIIDAGHGGVDSGATSASGVEEKHINLQIARKLKEIFTLAGHGVIMTREDDVSLQDPGVRRRKRSDLENRVDVADDHPGALFVSIHMNANASRSAGGMQIYYGTRNEGSAALAAAIRDLNRLTLHPANRYAPRRGRNIYIMENISNPAVLVECGFLTNPGDLANLTDPHYQNKLAYVIFGGVCEYMASPAAG